jgi:hypothetical protein
MITCDLIVKTFPGDYPWLEYLFRSIAKYATGYRDLLVIIEEQYKAPPLPEGARLIRCRQYEGTSCPPSRGVPIERLGAWRHSDADVLIFIDSDCVLCRPVDFQTDPTINLDRPVVLWTEWEGAGPCQKWRLPAQMALGYEPKVLTMCRYPFVFPREMLERCWNCCGGEERLRNIDLTDWEVIGNFALMQLNLRRMRNLPDDVTPVHASKAGPACVHQFWGQGGVTHPLTPEEIVAGKMGGGVQNELVQKKMKELGLC